MDQAERERERPSTMDHDTTGTYARIYVNIKGLAVAMEMWVVA